MHHSTQRGSEPKGYEKVTGLSAAKALTVPTGATLAMIKTEGADVRYRDDGTDPTTTNGMLLETGDEFWYSGAPRALRFIETSTSATLHVLYYA